MSSLFGLLQRWLDIYYSLAGDVPFGYRIFVPSLGSRNANDVHAKLSICGIDAKMWPFPTNMKKKSTVPSFVVFFINRRKFLAKKQIVSLATFCCPEDADTNS